MNLYKQKNALGAALRLIPYEIKPLEELGLGDLVERLTTEHVVAVPATEIAREHLGRPLPNAALLGAFAALTGELSLRAVTDAIRERFPGPVGVGNASAAEAAYAFVLDALRTEPRRSVDA